MIPMSPLPEPIAGLLINDDGEILGHVAEEFINDADVIRVYTEAQLIKYTKAEAKRAMREAARILGQ